MSVDALSKAKVHFSWDIIQQLKTDQSNVFCSPVSILGAFSMLLAGAKGQSATELKEALHLTTASVKEDQLHSQLGQLLHTITHDTGEVSVTLANRAYVQKKFSIDDTFVGILRSAYNGDMGRINFENVTVACDEVNNWVSKQTNNKINNMLTSSSLEPDVKLLLVNAIHFKGEWQTKFLAPLTDSLAFYPEPNKSISVEMMSGDISFELAESDDLKADLLALPFRGKRFSLLVLLPRERCALGQVEQSLTGDKLTALLENLSPNHADVLLPKFKLETSMDLNEVMQKLGVKSIFDRGSADLSGISSTEPLFVSKAVHKAFLEVNEEGVEAAAATMMQCVPLCGGGLGGPMYAINHPFLAGIYDKQTKTVLFMARVINPKLN